MIKKLAQLPQGVWFLKSSGKQIHFAHQLQVGKPIILPKTKTPVCLLFTDEPSTLLFRKG